MKKLISGLILALVAVLGFSAPAQADQFSRVQENFDGHHYMSMLVHWERVNGGQGTRVTAINIICDDASKYLSPAVNGVRLKLTAGDGTELWERTGDNANIPGDCNKTWFVDQNWPNRDRVEVWYAGFPVYNLQHDHGVTKRTLLKTLD